MIVLDTSFLYALVDRGDRNHRRAAAANEQIGADLATTPLVLAETDYLLSAPEAVLGLRAFRRDVATRAYTVEWWAQAGAECVAVADRYDDLDLGLTDASLVALAQRLRTHTIATFDERHFRVVRPLSGAGSFRLLPADL